MENRFNQDTYVVIDKITGKEVPMKLFVERVSKDKWERAYAQTVAEYIGVVGNASNKVLAYIIASKDSKNRINGTHIDIAKAAGVSTKSATSVIALLREKGMLKKVRNGCYFLNPYIMSYGSKVHGSMLMRIWGDMDEGDS